ncbi:MAG TPA: class I SAM-dependent methyltransferase [Candidatus Handelsmanbacteria bacterium]|nr:class I SAM-dependent methyltransferase [Candidatus Handelsmanbacteria bacterium]
MTATDISATGLQWLNRWARECGVDVESVVTDLVSWEPGTTCWDLVTMVSYLQPAFFPAIRRALRPGGLFLFHTFGPKQLEQSWGPRSAAHLAEPDSSVGLPGLGVTPLRGGCVPTWRWAPGGGGANAGSKT